MAKYMFRTSYTQSGLKGLLAEGGTGREAATAPDDRGRRAAPLRGSTTPSEIATST